jgi:antitoxin YefM
VIRETTYTHARAHLAGLCDRVAEDREPVIIRRRGKEPVAIIAASELESLAETAHLLRSPKNAARLLRALGRAKGGRLRARTVAGLRREIGLTDPEE